MKLFVVPVILAALAMFIAPPVQADDDHHEHHGHWGHHHDHERDRYYGNYAPPGCRVEGGYDRGGYYHERQVCPGPRVAMPFAPMLPYPPMAPAVVLQPPALVIQPPGVYFR